MSKETETRAAFERSVAIFMAFAYHISFLTNTGWLYEFGE
jgi:hypothetical protein